VTRVEGTVLQGFLSALGFGSNPAERAEELKKKKKKREKGKGSWTRKTPPLAVSYHNETPLKSCRQYRYDNVNLHNHSSRDNRYASVQGRLRQQRFLDNRTHTKKKRGQRPKGMFLRSLCQSQQTLRRKIINAHSAQRRRGVTLGICDPDEADNCQQQGSNNLEI